MQLFYERRTFSLLRWRLGGVPRCMGRSDGKRNAPTTGRRGRRPLQAAAPTREFCQRAGLTRGGKSHTIRSNRADLAGVACTPPLQERRATG